MQYVLYYITLEIARIVEYRVKIRFKSLQLGFVLMVAASWL